MLADVHKDQINADLLAFLQARWRLGAFDVPTQSA